MVASEIGAEPQAIGDPETMDPVYGTCLMPGVVPSECTPDCAYACETPECSLGCFCGCNAQAKQLHVTMLAQQQQNMKVLAARDEVGGNVYSEPGARFWEKSLRALDKNEQVDSRRISSARRFHLNAKDKQRLDTLRAASEVRFEEAKDKRRARARELALHAQKTAHSFASSVREALQQRKASPRYKAHKLLAHKLKEAHKTHAKARARKGRRISRDPFAEADGFSWDKLHPVDPYRRGQGLPKTDNSPYETEVNRLDNVFDPAEDWDNFGSTNMLPDGTTWWSIGPSQVSHVLATDDHWWRHGWRKERHGIGAGRPHPFGSYDNDKALGWY